MTMIWLLLVLLSLNWYPLTGIYEPTNIHYSSPLWFSFGALVGAIVCGAFSGKKICLELTRKGAILFFTSVVLFSLIIPFPYKLSSIFLMTGVLIIVLQSRLREGTISGILQRISTSIFVCGLVLAIQTALLPFFFLFASRFHRLDIAGPITASLFNVLGSSASFSGGDLFVQSGDKVYSFIPSWDAMGLYWMLNVFVGGYCLFYLFSAPKRYYLVLPVVLLLYMPIRYLGVIFTFLELSQANVFWRLDVLTLTLLPLPWVLARAVPMAFTEATASLKSDRPYRDRNVRWFAISMTVLVISCVSFFGFVDPGEKKHGKILIDEKHSNWEWTTEEFNTTWYGEKSTYNYYSLAQYLKYFYTVDQKAETLTDTLLSKYDVLFIKTPTEPFSRDEIAAIRSFVQKGGGLLLVGDHTNVFGITTNLNPLASQFGIKFRYDGQYDLDGELSIYKKPKVLPHPVVQEMPAFMFATGCMLDAPLMAENAIIGYGIKSIYLDYARKNFFPKDAKNSENMEFGLFVQAAGVSFGKGRVFLFTDSTVWSNFYMFIPGKPELLLGIMQWLNRRNSMFVILRLLALVVGILALGAAVVFGRKLGNQKVLSPLFFVGFLVTPLAVSGIEKLNQYSYPSPEPHTKYVKVNFESQHSEFELPLLHTTQQPEKSYHTFFVWLQRLGYVPSLRFSYEDALRDGDAVVILNPHRPFEEKEIQGTRKFLERGGRVFLMDEPRHTRHRVANQLLSRFGEQLIATDTLMTAVNLMRSASDTARIATSSAGEVRGGNPLLYARTRISVAAQALPPGAVGGLRIREGESPSPDFPRVPQDWEAGKESRTLPSRKFKTEEVADLAPVPDTTSSRPVLAVREVGKGKLLAMASSFVFTDREMGSSSVLPNTNMRRIYDLEYWIFQEVLRLGSESRPLR